MVLKELNIIEQIEEVSFKLNNLKTELKNSLTYNNVLLLNKL